MQQPLGFHSLIYIFILQMVIMIIMIRHLFFKCTEYRKYEQKVFKKSFSLYQMQVILLSEEKDHRLT